MAIATRRLDGRGVREVNVVPRAAALAVSQHSVLEAAITLLVFHQDLLARARLGCNCQALDVILLMHPLTLGGELGGSAPMGTALAGAVSAPR